MAKASWTFGLRRDTGTNDAIPIFQRLHEQLVGPGNVLRSAWIWTMGASRCNSAPKPHPRQPNGPRRDAACGQLELRDILPPIQAGVRAVEDLDRRTFATRP